MKKHVKLVAGFLLLFLFAGTATISQVNKLVKRIEIVESNNPAILNLHYQTMGLPDSVNTPEAMELKQFALDHGLKVKEKDIDMILEMMRWVSSQWTHDGNNNADTLTPLQILKNALQGTRYRCVEYGRVLNSVLRSFGFLGRGLGLRTKDAAYGPPGSAHFATEVWSDDLNKWIFLDPQNCIYAMYKGRYLNYYDIYLLKKQGRFKEIQFIISAGYTGYKAMGKATAQQHINDSREFLSQYFGSLSFPVNRFGNVSIVLLMETSLPYFTFQGFPSGEKVFTKDPADVYFPVNQNVVIFKFRDFQKHMDRYNELVKNKTIATWEDQVPNMHLFAPTPDFVVIHDHNMPWYSHAELWLNGKQVLKNEKGRLEVSFQEGINTIRSVAVNKNGKRGSETIIKIRYGTAEK